MATPTTLPATFVSGDVLTAAQMNDLRGGFRVLQVLSTAKIDTFSSSSTSYVDVTGLSVAITPQFSTSKILVMAQINAGVSNTADSSAHFKLVGGNTASYLPAAVGSRTSAEYSLRFRASASEMGYWGADNGCIQYLDSPATTSATTYKVQIIVPLGTGYVNRGGEDANVASISRLSSSITVMEISA